MIGTAEIVKKAQRSGLLVPAFNIAYIPMTEPVIRAIVDEDAFALLEVARLEWRKFGAESMEAVIKEYRRWENQDHVRLHLDHIPVID